VCDSQAAIEIIDLLTERAKHARAWRWIGVSRLRAGSSSFCEGTERVPHISFARA
jgi:hypothetical protein